jgi:type II secretory pathway component PulF
LPATASSLDLARFNAAMALAVERGIALPHALGLAAVQAAASPFREAIEETARRVRDGEGLGAAMRSRPDAFAPEYCALVEAAVASGRLADLLRNVEAYHALRERLRRAAGRLLLYLGVGFAACVGVLEFIRWPMREMGRIFDQLGMRELPPLTALSVQVAAHWWGPPAVAIAAALPLLGAWALFRWFRSRFGLAYALPVVGRVLKSRDLAWICAATAMQLEAGATMPDAVATARDAVRNRALRGRLDRIRARVAEGEPLSTALFYDGWFPRTLAWAVSLGETRGDLPETLGTFARIYSAQLERAFVVMLAALSPVGILVIGNVVLFFVLSMFLPLIQIQRHLAGP